LRTDKDRSTNGQWIGRMHKPVPIVDTVKGRDYLAVLPELTEAILREGAEMEERTPSAHSPMSSRYRAHPNSQLKPMAIEPRDDVAEVRPEGFDR
jgi:hypothetical protein